MSHWEKEYIKTLEIYCPECRQVAAYVPLSDADDFIITAEAVSQIHGVCACGCQGDHNCSYKFTEDDIHQAPIRLLLQEEFLNAEVYTA